MTLHEFTVQALTILAPLVLAALTGIVGILTPVITKYIHNARLAKVLETGAGIMATLVANMYQTVVRGLKDESKPGEWTPAAAFAAKTAVIDAFKATAPNVLLELQALGVQQIDALLGSWVEQSVVALKTARLPPVTPEDALPVAVVPNEEKTP